MKSYQMNARIIEFAANGLNDTILIGMKGLT